MPPGHRQRRPIGLEQQHWCVHAIFGSDVESKIVRFAATHRIGCGGNPHQPDNPQEQDCQVRAGAGHPHEEQQSYGGLASRHVRRRNQGHSPGRRDELEQRHERRGRETDSEHPCAQRGRAAAQQRKQCERDEEDDADARDRQE